ncbi:uncharacterized protein PGTG_21678 [Puccinia graminis f. sp. tritici CRL 75-36-700-3]|uniref:Uncharacterized protein n=2 Tax=Puccinia graminis f. sp. tritici TaxID=56615 RepID=H6QS68_PUCGT|nr:uncharacterized protein PGTG_21678 [Puccinia graminis f. sp. tritici CRL 75-36-700-3]EHS63502.1 hypothetical protein PGTG_21678 [Puccinia graminis f. sp. tritici CRL 75-36-700-3]
MVQGYLLEISSSTATLCDPALPPTTSWSRTSRSTAFFHPSSSSQWCSCSTACWTSWTPSTSRQSLKLQLF